MQHSISDKIHRINYLTSELEGLYHITSVKMNISDSVSRVLYTIYIRHNTPPSHHDFNSDPQLYYSFS